MTNEEKIKSMTREQLAAFLYGIYECVCCAYVYGCCNETNKCKEGILKWLEERADEDAE